MNIAHTKKFHFCFLASKCYGINLLPLEIISLFNLVHKNSGNEEVSLIFVAFILNSCCCIQHIAVVYYFPFQIADLGTNHFSKMQSCLKLRPYSEFFEIVLA